MTSRLQTIIAVCLSVSLHSIAAQNVRLSGTTGREGRLEVFYNGTWGTVCGDSFDSDAASVACTSLGFRKVDQYWTEASPVPGDSSAIWLAGVICDGWESSLFDCEYGTIGDHNCSHGEDIYLNCTEPFVVNVCRFRECPEGASCINIPGGYTCKCNTGFYDDGDSCSDVNECLTNNGGCSTNAVCSNTEGSFTCACNSGYNGNGYTCTDRNDCLTSTGGCHMNAECFNTRGNFSCKCNTGFSGDGFSCIDVNECLTNNGGCGTNEVCSNTPGRFTCQCKSGYVSDGYTCTVIISYCSRNVTTFVAGNGTITSPKYSAAYLLDEQCQWLIVSSLSNGAVRLLFNTMSTDPRYTFVELYDGYNAFQTEIELLSGSSYSAAGYSTTQRYMFIAFVSRLAVNLNGFSASYSTFEYTGTKTIDGVTYPKNVILLNAGTGTFTTPNYPENFPFLAYFEWLIVSSSASGAVRLHFNSMSIAPGFDFVILYDGFNASYKQIERISGALPSTNSYSTTQRYMFITFTSNAQKPSKGFRATFSTFEYTKPTPTSASDSANGGSSSLPCLALIVIALVSLIPYCLHHVETDHIPAVGVLMLSMGNHHTAP